MRSRAGRFVQGTDGAALIEAALILPLLLLLVFALADLSLYFWQQSLTGKAVQLGVRTAVVSDSVAVGPGLTPEESESYWYGLPPGARCGLEGGPCPAFRVVCTLRDGCTCTDGRCRFSFSLARLAPILAAMRAVLPQLAPENIEVAYATNGLGTVGLPPPVPVDVTVRIVGLSFTPIFSGLFGTGFPLAASSTLPSEDLVTRP